jgi:hypothetical protein
VGGGNGKLAFSNDDGANWTLVVDGLLGGGVTIRSIGFGGGTFIAAGDSGNMKIAAWGDVGDDSNWTGVDSKFDKTGILGLAFGNSKFVAVGHNGKISESLDGTNWTAIAPGPGTGQSKFTTNEQIRCIVYGGRFVAGGNAYQNSANASKIAYNE